MHSRHKNILVISIIILALVSAVIWNRLSKTANNKHVVDKSINDTSITSINNDKGDSNIATKVILEVPFISQAPTGNWDDSRQQDGCEEASLLMAWSWANGKNSINSTEAEQTIIYMSEFEHAEYGNYLDLSAQDTVKLMKDYFKYEKISFKLNINIDDIKESLRAGKLVIVPANGKRLNNPNFSNGGPITHMFVIKGFDDSKQQFITNDPGTRRGNGFVYSYDTVANAMVNYPTGYHEDQTGQPTAMIIIEK